MKSSVELMADAYCPLASFAVSSFVTSMVVDLDGRTGLQLVLPGGDHLLTAFTTGSG